MLTKLLESLSERIRSVFVEYVLVGFGMRFSGVVNGSIVAFPSLPKALEYVKAQKPNYFRRFRLIALPDIIIPEMALAIPPYCNLDVLCSDSWLRLDSRHYLILMGDEDPCPVLMELAA